jgi:hypothetical protein
MRFGISQRRLVIIVGYARGKNKPKSFPGTKHISICRTQYITVYYNHWRPYYSIKILIKNSTELVLLSAIINTA